MLRNSIRAHWSIRFVPRTLFKTVDSKQILMKQKLVVTCTLANWFLPSDFCPRYRSYFVRFSNWHSSMDLAAILWWTCVNHRVVNDAGMIQRQDVCDDDLAVFWFLLSPKTCRHINNKPERKKNEKKEEIPLKLCSKVCRIDLVSFKLILINGDAYATKTILLSISNVKNTKTLIFNRFFRTKLKEFINEY